jgi:hypothetical protein
VDTLKSQLQTERAAHTHAVQQYVAELEHRSQLQGQLADERAAKEHAIFLQHRTEKSNVHLQVRSLQGSPSWLLLALVKCRGVGALHGGDLVFPQTRLSASGLCRMKLLGRRER